LIAFATCIPIMAATGATTIIANDFYNMLISSSDILE